MIPIVFDHQGTLDKLMGDAVMAFFAAPGELNEHPLKAAQTALEMIERLKALKAERGERGIERLEVGIGLNKTYGTSIIISESTARRLNCGFVLRELDRVRVKGKKDAVTIFELLGLGDKLDPERMKMLGIFEAGLLQYKSRAWEEAEETFSRALNLSPDDGPSRLYSKRTKDLLKNPPSPEWEPITVFTAK